MTRLVSKALGFALAVSLSLASPAAGVLLDSSGSNNEYIGVANFAHSYASSPIKLVGNCYLNGAKDSFWEAPSTCTPGNEACWATTCDDCGDDAAAQIIVGSTRKALLHYYARDHKDDGQGSCNFTIGTSSFSLSFEFEYTGVHFSLSLIPGTTGPAWVSDAEEGCPSPVYPSGLSKPNFGANIEVSNPYNLICNQDFVVSLTADPDVSDGAMLSVTNNPYGLSLGVQEILPSSSTLTGQELATNLRRLADRPTDEGRWLVTGDRAGDSFEGILISESEAAQEVEFVACEKFAGEGGGDSALEDYGYTCNFVSEDGMRNRTQGLSLPGTLLRPLALASPAPGPTNGPADTGLAVGILERVHGLAALARVAAPAGDNADLSESADTEGSRPVVWYGGGAKRRIVMVQNRGAERLEIVSHTAGGLSPIFVSCTERTEDARNLGYVCRSATRCVGAPCSPEAWSGGRAMEFPKALFKDRPCRPDEGGEVQRARLKLSRLGTGNAAPKLRFRSTLEFEEGVEVSPQSDGFRFLVEDARGQTVVDVDVPPAGAGDSSSERKAHSKGWRVRKGGKDLRYRARESVGGVVPRVAIRKRGKDSNRWDIDVKGKRGLFGEDDLALPLTASLSLGSKDPNSEACAVVPFLGKSQERPDDDSDAKPAKPACKQKHEGQSIDCRQRRR